LRGFRHSALGRHRVILASNLEIATSLSAPRMYESAAFVK